jgi:hypothetical protein
MLPLDASSLECLVAIAILSYVLGYLAAQTHFPDGPSGDPYFWFEQSPEDQS